MKPDTHGIMYEELTYKIRGSVFEIRKEYGPGQKEIICQRLIKEKLDRLGLRAEREKKISIYSQDSGKIIGIYQPDLCIEERILLEIKSSRFSSPLDEKQLSYYLRNSSYELGLLINVSTARLFIKRIIYTNDRKPFLKT